MSLFKNISKGLSNIQILKPRKQKRPAGNRRSRRANKKKDKRKKRILRKRRRAFRKKNIKSPLVNKRIFRKKYRLIYKLHLHDRVPKSITDNLRIATKNKTDGAVQKIATNIPNTPVAYDVVVITEADMEKSGLTTKSQDLGDLGSSLSNSLHLILSATMFADLRNGRIVIVPTDRSLRTLSEYPHLSKIKYHWALFTGKYDNNSRRNTVMMLDNSVSLHELRVIDKKGLKLSYKDHKIVHASAHPNEDKNGNFVPDSASSSSSNDPFVGATRTSSQPTSSNSPFPPNESSSTSNSESDNDQGPNLAAFLGQSGSSNSASQGNNSTSSYNNTKSASANPSASRLNSSTASSVSNGRDSPFGATQDTGSKGTPSGENPFPFNNGPSDSTSSNGGDNPFGAPVESAGGSSSKDSGDALYEEARSAAGAGYKLNGHTRRKRFNEHKVTQPKKSPSDYFASLDKYTARELYDSSLGLKVDTTGLKYRLRRMQPKQFAVKNVSASDRLGRLVNARRHDLNQNLVTYHREHINSILSQDLNDIQQAISQINSKLDPYSKGTLAHKVLAKYEQKYKDNKNGLTRKQRFFESNVDKKYNSDRANIVHRAEITAGNNYDHQYGDVLSNKKKQHFQDISDQVHEQLLTNRAHLKKRRIRKAKTMIHGVLNIVENDDQKRLAKLDHQESALYYSYEDQLKKLALDNYKQENLRIQTIAQSNDQQRENVKLRRKMSELHNNYKDVIRGIKQDNHQDILNATKKANFTNESLRSKIERMQRKMRHIRRDVANQYEEQLRVRNDNYNGLRQQNDQISQQNEHRAKYDSHRIKELTSQNEDTQQKLYRGHVIDAAIVAAVIFVCGGTTLYFAHRNSIDSQVRVESNANNSANNSAPSSNSNPSSSSPSSQPSNDKPKTTPEPKPKSSHPKANRGLMITRPRETAGEYIATSDAHNPTSYVEVIARGHYQLHSAIACKINGKTKQYVVDRVKGKRIWVKDPSNSRTYEFND